MTAYVIDTNVISELARPSPHSSVIAFLNNSSNVYVSAIVFHEIAYGIERMADDVRKARLLTFADMFKARFVGRILPVNTPVAETGGRMRAVAARKGRVLSPLDSLIAATAMMQGATLATRNIKDFEYLGIELLDPWQDREH